jgi:pimeloyl-ACP methyl ester carboxylesterase
MASDIVASSRGDPVPVDRIRTRVRLWYGDADWIGPEHGRWYAAQLADAQLTLVPGAGHLLPLTNWRLILDAALTA